MLLVALWQGAALHYLDCLRGAKKKNGVKDLDVYSFYAKDPKLPWPYRRHGKADFGESEFGYYSHAGRPFEPDGPGPAREARWRPGRGSSLVVDHQREPTPQHLRQKAVVGPYPARYRGKIIWGPSADQ